MELQFLEVAAGLGCVLVLEIQTTIGENPPLVLLEALGYKVAKGFAPNLKVKEGGRPGGEERG
jgi:hypothetical protein